MKQISAIKIYHDIKNRMVYNFWADYFRFLGIYVGEGIISECTMDEVREDYKCFQIIFYISKDGKEAIQPNKYLAEIDDLFYIDLNKYMDLSYVGVDYITIQSEVDAMIDRIVYICKKKNIYISDDTLLKQMARIFIEENLLKASYNLQYYRMKTSLHEETCRIYQQVLRRLEKDEVVKDYSDELCVQYAKLLCKQKINLSCIYQENRGVLYSINGLAEECDNLMYDFPTFSNGWVLQGMVYEISHDHGKLAIDAYNKALGMVGMYCYASHIYYWIGKLYEGFEMCHEDAKKAYTLAYKHKKKYRNIYKLGQMASEEGDYDTELKYYEECWRRLDQRRSIMLDPLELEYYYKTGVLAAYNCVFHKEDYTKGIEYAQKMLDFIMNKSQLQKYFNYFYKEQANRFENYSMGRISLTKAYDCLIMAYESCGNIEMAAKFGEKLEEYQIRKH